MENSTNPSQPPGEKLDRYHAQGLYISFVAYTFDILSFVALTFVSVEAAKAI